MAPERLAELLARPKHRMTRCEVELREEVTRLATENACPCCKSGVTLSGEPCQDCRESGLACVAYDVCRIRYKRLAAENADLRKGAEHKTRALDGMTITIRQFQTALRESEAFMLLCNTGHVAILSDLLVFAESQLCPEVASCRHRHCAEMRPKTNTARKALDAAMQATAQGGEGAR